MILSSGLTLQFVLTAAKTTNDFDLTIDYRPWNDVGEQLPPDTFRAASNGSTAVTLLAAPSGRIRALEPIALSCYNKDTADKTAVIQTVDNAASPVTKLEIKILVPTLKTLRWNPANDFYVTT